MRKVTDIHNYDRRLKSALRKIKESDKISDNNKATILKFTNSCFAEGLSKPRIERYVQMLHSIAVILRKDFEKASRNDIEKVMAKIERKSYSPWTKQIYRVTFKKFYRWLRGGEDYPPEVKWIKTTIKSNETKLPEQLLTEKDIKRMIEVTMNSRDKALISLLYESGCRISELLLMKIKHVVRTGDWYRITVHGKTGTRKLLIIASVPYLDRWIAEHPFKDDTEAYLWIGIGKVGKDKIVSYSTIRAMLKRISKRAGIKKSVNPHMFRHSRATILSKDLSDAQMKQFFGWTQGSDMASVYVHLSGKDLDASLLKSRGIKTKAEAKKEDVLAPKVCPSCGEINPATATFCNKCDKVIDLRTAIELDSMKSMFGELVDIVFGDKKIRTRIKKLSGKDPEFVEKAKTLLKIIG